MYNLDLRLQKWLLVDPYEEFAVFVVYLWCEFLIIRFPRIIFELDIGLDNDIIQDVTYCFYFLVRFGLKYNLYGTNT